MMKLLKGLFAVLGIVAIVAAAVLLVVKLWPDVNTIMGAANQGRSNNLYHNPMDLIMLIAGVGAAGGLLLGLGLGMPSRTAGGIRKDALKEVDARREADIRDRARQVDRAPRRDEEIVEETRVVREPEVRDADTVEVVERDHVERTHVDRDKL